MPHATVVGGGITGLVAAFRLSQHPGFDVSLLEARPGVGGKINTIDVDGARVELGPDSFLARDEKALDLFRDIGLEAELVEPADFGAWIYRAGRLQKFPPETALGFPSGPRAVRRSNMLSPVGKVRALAETLRATPLRGPDVSVGQFTRSRFGREVHDHLVEPLLPRIRAGRLEEMSLAATLPELDALARANRSLLLALGKRRVSAPRFYAPAGGMHRVVEALEDAAPSVQLKRSSRVRAIERTTGRYRIALDDQSLETDAVIIALPSYAAAGILSEISQEASRLLAAIPHGASTIVNLVFSERSVRPPAGGSGILIPSSEQMTLSGCTWFSDKWPHLAASGRQTIRCFVVHDKDDPSLLLSDRDLTGVVVEELRRIVEVSAQPVASHVTRWEAGLPIYRVGHLQRIAHIEEVLASDPRIRLAGASYRGSGIPDCIAQAEQAATDLIADLRG